MSLPDVSALCFTEGKHGKYAIHFSCLYFIMLPFKSLFLITENSGITLLCIREISIRISVEIFHHICHLIMDFVFRS